MRFRSLNGCRPNARLTKEQPPALPPAAPTSQPSNTVVSAKRSQQALCFHQRDLTDPSQTVVSMPKSVQSCAKFVLKFPRFCGSAPPSLNDPPGGLGSKFGRSADEAAWPA